MVRPGTVLVLGAGASYDFGFPLGASLTNLIQVLCGQVGGWSSALLRQEDMKAMCESFAGSGAAQIDAFVEQRPEFSNAASILVSGILLEREQSWRDNGFVNMRGNEGHLYQYIWSKLSAPKIDDLKLHHLKVVTFNYERSFQAYIYRCILNAYKLSHDEVSAVLRTLEVVHVHGSLGEIDTTSDEFHPFGQGSNINESITLAAARLRFLNDARTPTAQVVRAREILLGAQHIGILGFAFDEANLERLDARKTLHGFVDIDGEPRRHREVVASCRGLSTLAANRLSRKLSVLQYSDDRYPAGFIHADCLTTLKETLILGEWAE